MRLLLFILAIIPSFISAQSDTWVNSANEGHKGKAFIYWGYNRAYYNKSDIHFKGDGYDFTLYDVEAKDMPEPFDADVYFNIKKLSIPQFNFRAGYFFSDNWSLSLGWDHMKYRIMPYQLVEIDGSIDPEAYPDSPGFTGDFDHQNIFLDPSFIQYEHSDGFNFLRLELQRRMEFWVSKKGREKLCLLAGVSAGAMLPWTDFTFMGTRYLNFVHLAGYGGSVHLTARFEFFKHLFIQYEAQYGLTRLSDIVLEDHASSRADQNISFFQRSVVLGGYIPLFTKKNKKD